jgi:hypothetical protein
VADNIGGNFFLLDKESYQNIIKAEVKILKRGVS